MNQGLVLSALLLGLAGSGHCASMCGGASGTVLRLLSPQGGALLRFHAGRVAGYALLGLVAALLGQELQRAAALTGALRPVWTMTNAAALFVGMTLLLTGRQPAFVDRMGQGIARRWSRLVASVDAAEAPGATVASVPAAALRGTRAAAGGSVVGKHAIATPRAAGYRAVALGACWSLMPCGLLWSAVLLAMLSGDAASGGAAMAAFALASAIPMLAMQRLLSPLGWLGRWERLGNPLVGAAVAGLAGWGLFAVVTGQGQGLFCLPGAS